MASLWGEYTVSKRSGFYLDPYGRAFTIGDKRDNGNVSVNYLSRKKDVPFEISIELAEYLRKLKSPESKTEPIELSFKEKRSLPLRIYRAYCTKCDILIKANDYDDKKLKDHVEEHNNTTTEKFVLTGGISTAQVMFYVIQPKCVIES